MTSGENHGGAHHGSGDMVNIFGGEGHAGIVHHHGGPPPQPTLEEALRTVVELMRVLRAEVPPEDRGSFDDALPVLAADEAATASPVRRRALLTVAGIAAMLGTVGTPLLDAARAALELLGVGG
ncbi:hypothetical protein ASC82_26070 [Streptomyces sp. Root431]|uniref:hypothetical protein n=1 Tax=Streptomyces sp. Root431 TaxID=1736535 RepID=UPI0006FD2BBD|nr:hypothetical protein [Streptomyces sp. Root431]KQX09391.1 hypothetical protein ASC82_26070 [Streptomyces sp. Root431]